MNRSIYFRVLFVLIIAILAAVLIYYVFLQTIPDFLPLLQRGNEAEIEEYLRTQTDVMGIICMALLQAVQVFSVVLPGAPIQIAAGVVFGTLRSFLICHLSSVVANVLVFIAARKLGNKLNKLIPMEKKASKLNFLRQSETPEYMTVVACLIPVLPNGVIPYVAAKTRITPKHFALAVYFGSFFPVLILCAIGRKILEGGYIAALVLLGVLFAAAFLLTKFRQPILRIVRRFFPSACNSAKF